jgi:hypothetical protein
LGSPVNRILHSCAALILAASSVPAAADVSVLIDTRSSSSEQFLVTVHTRHADFHNGYSRVRFEGLVQANRRTQVPIEFYFTRIGYGVTAYHPDYLLESAVTRQRTDDVPALFPRHWDAVLGAVTSLPINGPEPTYAGIVGHVQLYRDQFLPALDRAGIAPDPAVVPRLASLLAKADALTTFPEPANNLERYDRSRLREQRASVLPDIEKLLASSRARRLALIAYREAAIGPKRLIAALQKEPDYPKLLEFVSSVNARKPPSALPQAQSWHNPTTGLQLTYRIDRWYRQQRDADPPDCARGQLTFDGRPMVEGVSGDLVKRIDVDFCRRPDGLWSIAGRSAR